MKYETQVLQIVPEKVIKDAAQVLEKEEKHNTFTYALEAGKVYKEHNLTPLYLLDEATTSIYVTSKERIKKKFH